MKETYSYELTDTFCGEANYSWARRGSVEVKQRKESESYKAHESRIIRAVKASLGYSGQRCRRVDMGDTIALYPAGECTVIFIS